MKEKIISYFGKERCDLMYAMASVASATHKKVLIIDYSIMHDFYMIYATEGQEEENEILDMGNVVVVKDRKIPETDMRNFDLTIIYNGLNLSSIVYQKADEYILAPGDEAGEVLRTAKYVKAIEEMYDAKFTLIQRDKANRKQTLGTLSQKLNIRPKRSYVLSFDQIEYEAYIALTINGNGGAIGLTNEMQAVAAELICTILEDDEKRIRKILKKI